MIRLVVADLHIPFEWQTYLQFCKEVAESWNCQEEICIGDVCDNHAISRFLTHESADSAANEYKLTKKRVQKWYEMFPGLKIVKGNHDRRPLRGAAKLNIPSLMIKDLNDLWNTPKWEWQSSFDLDNVHYTHGEGTSGPTAALRRAITRGQSVVMGHLHTYGGIHYHMSGNNLIFGMNVGCGLDSESFAFDYARDYVVRPTLGCGVVVSKSEAYFIPLNKARYGRRKIDRRR